MEIKVLSVRQPWASLLLSGVKKYECRSWGPKRPGVLLMHASSGKAGGLPQLRTERLYQQAIAKAGLEEESAWPSSAIIGAVDVIRIWTPDRQPRLTVMDEYLVGDPQDAFLWEVGRRWLFPTSVRCHGKLMLWTPPPERRAALTRHLNRLGVPLDRLCA
ncbi:MAG: ASCH domain-containing protein [Candidatus Binatia bacterium]